MLHGYDSTEAICGELMEENRKLKEMINEDFFEDEIYPLTITADRYNGTYSGGKYIAWNLLAEDIPEGTESDDVDCYSFWLDNEIVCGKGNTVSEALADLYVKLKECEQEYEEGEAEWNIF